MYIFPCVDVYELNRISKHKPALSYFAFAELWKLVEVHLPLWSNEYNGINVVAGPIFDFDADGFRDHANVTNEQG